MKEERGRRWKREIEKKRVREGRERETKGETERWTKSEKKKGRIRQR